MQFLTLSENLFDLDIINKSAYCRPLNTKTDIVHWGTRFTKSIPYLKEMAALLLNLQGASEKEIKKSNKHHDKLLAKEKANQFKTRIFNKINRTLNKS